MPLSRTLSPACSPASAVRQALIGSLYRAHRPELADVVATADLAYDWASVWLRPADATLDGAWLEQQFTAAALASGLSFASIRVLAGGPGREETAG